MVRPNTLLKASLVAGFITPPILDDLLQVEFGPCSSSIMAQAPPVVWKDIMPAPSRPSFGAYYTWNGSNNVIGDPATGGAMAREEGGEDWWYDICELKDASGNLIGYAAAGYNTVPNWGYIDDLGCGSSLPEEPVTGEFETNEHRKGDLRCWVAKYELDGTMAWCRSSLPGVFYGVTQDVDGSIVAAGEASHNRMGTLPAISHPAFG